MATVWILNHYATNMFFDHGGRHYEFAKQLIKKGYSVRIFCASTIHNSNTNLIEDKRKYYEDTCDGIPYVFIKTRDYTGNSIRRVLNMTDYYYGMLSAAKHFEKPDVIWGSSVHPLACAAAIRLSKKYRCKNIVEIRDLWPESIVAYGIARKNNPLVKILYSLEKWLYTKADSIIFTMEGGRDYIIEKGWDKQTHGGPVDLSKVYYINNGVDLEMFNYNREHYTFEDADLDDPETFKVVYTGSIRKVNNVGQLIEVARKLKTDGQNRIKFIIYGDGDERAQLEADCAEFDNIVFKGKIDKKYIPFVLSKSDLNLMHGKQSPIVKYGLSFNKMFEYFAAGKPLLSDIETNFDLVKKYKAGISASNQSPREIANMITAAANLSPEEYKELSKGAVEAAHDYSFEHLTSILLSVVGE